MDNIEQEIANLERQLAEKRAAMEQGGSAPEQIPSEKEMLRQTVGEKIQQQSPRYQPAPQPAGSAPAAPGTDQPSYLTPELKDAVQKLVDTVFASSLNDAIQQAVKANNPALLDAFHDVIVDQLYNELLTRKKITQVQ